SLARLGEAARDVLAGLDVPADVAPFLLQGEHLLAAADEVPRGGEALGGEAQLHLPRASLLRPDRGSTARVRRQEGPGTLPDALRRRPAGGRRREGALRGGG